MGILLNGNIKVPTLLFKDFSSFGNGLKIKSKRAHERLLIIDAGGKLLYAPRFIPIDICIPTNSVP